jgi:ribosomal protein S18 acetylase RimI-like enzyme
MNIRRLVLDDLKIGVAAIQNIKRAQATTGVVAQFLKRPDQYFIAAIEDDRPIGFALAYELERIDRPHPMMFLYEIEVVESHQRQGVATAMIELLKEICREKDAFKMFVIAAASNNAALRLYDSTFGDTREIKRENVVYSIETNA